MSAIERRIKAIDALRYASTRNYVDGAVTYLSPYISRGVISTKQIFQHLLSLELHWSAIEKLVQELAWRDYWQEIWTAKGHAIKSDLKHIQAPIFNHAVPTAILDATTGIDVVDRAIIGLYDTGYMHNHMRMYVASICCNMANSHWLQPAQWMYSHLLDGDLASNHLSWQWVAGAFSNKKYYANQDNINTFFRSSQKGTFLDVDYSEFDQFEVPNDLVKTTPFILKTILPAVERPPLNRNQTTLIYNYYNLDPHWYKDQDFQRVLLLEPSVFSDNPVGQNAIDFALKLSENIPDIKIFVGEFMDLKKEMSIDKIIYKEHPLNSHYSGREESRDSLSSVKGYYPSFFAFWKKCKKEIKY